MSDAIVVFTFDDIYSSVYSEAYSYMNSAGIPGTTYVASDWVGTVGKVTWANLQTMANGGWTVGNHTKTHVDLTTLSQADAQTELLNCKNAINANVTGGSPLHVGYPFGARNATTDAAMTAEGMLTGRTTNNGTFLLSNFVPYNISVKLIQASVSLATAEGWIDTAIANNEVCVLCFHDLVAAGATGYEWLNSDFEDLVDYVAAADITPLAMHQLYDLWLGASVIMIVITSTSVIIVQE